MSRVISCLHCSIVFDHQVERCPRCGGPIHVAITLTGTGAVLTPGNVGTVTDSLTEDGGRHVEFRAPSGARSSSRLVGGRHELEVSKPIESGIRGEPRVRALLRHTLSQRHRFVVELRSDDGRGEDGKFECDGEQVNVQIVTGLSDENFWARVARGTARHDSSLVDAATALHESIKAKSQRYGIPEKASMLLAVDVTHLGALASDLVIEKYLELFRGELDSFGFGAVWLVGPTESRVAQLGKSRW